MRLISEADLYFDYSGKHIVWRPPWVQLNWSNVVLNGRHYLGGPREESIDIYAQLHTRVFGSRS